MIIKEFETEIYAYEKIVVGDLVNYFTHGVAGYQDAEIVEISQPTFLRELKGWNPKPIYLVTGKVRILDRSEWDRPDYPGTTNQVRSREPHGK